MEMTREELEAYFAENREIQVGELTYGIMDWGDGRFDVLSPANNEQGYIVNNTTPFICVHDAINFTIDHILEAREKSVVVPKSTSKKKKKEEEQSYEGPRTVRVFGRDIYIEEDHTLSHEEIRQKLVNEFNFPNFKKKTTMYDFDLSTGTLEVMLKFNTKG